MNDSFVSLNIARDELNRNLGGGLPAGSLILIEGEDGAGKSVLSQRMAYSLLENDKTVTYISTELNTKGYVEQMKSIGYDIKYKLIEGKLLFIPMFPFIGKTKLADNFFDTLLSSTKLFESDVIFLDTLSFLLVSDQITQAKCFDVVNQLKKFTSMNKTIIFTVDPTHINKQLLTLLRAVADVYFSIDIKEFAGNIVRVIRTHRFKRPADTYITAYPSSRTKTGLAIEIASFD